MHKKQKFILFAIIYSNILVAQNTIRFNEAFQVIPGIPAITLNNVLVVPSGYVIYGSTNDSSNHGRALALKIDSMGKLLWEKNYYIKGFYYGFTYPWGEGGIKIPWGGGAVESLSNDTTGFLNWSIFRYDDTGDTLWTRIYKDSTNMGVYQIKLIRENKFLISGTWINFKNPQNWFETLVLIKTDSTGHKIWEKTYHDGNGYSVDFTGLDTCMDGGFIVSLYNYDTNYYCTGRIKIMKMDSTGKLQWTKYISGTPCDVVPGEIISLKHGGYAICGYYDDSNNIYQNYYPMLYLAKLSSTGSVTWAKKYGFFGSPLNDGLVALRELPNGDIVSCGYDETIYGCMLKVDSNGNQIWLRYDSILSATDVDYLTDMQLTPDGGFIASGYTYPNPEDIWVVKVDSNGCDSAGCDVTGSEELRVKSEELRVFPNPNNGVFTVVLGHAELVSASQYKIEIYNMFGQNVFNEMLKQVQHDYEINLSSQPNGVYFYRVVTKSGGLVGEGKVVIEH